ncbi:vacuolar ATP synthase subunit S1-domain-containing protein [Podospora aff. communis PSN243]|uniref:Protein BIG1 n=1 Tax=Podospora aff. communis PSN243 TaxID=3040156 RepID=A0AAV9H0B3_9PEZI|nr:vacuolar ATP synthase subunit S1-domain-containing protein [Podospora aff. communis PSN243]
MHHCAALPELPSLRERPASQQHQSARRQETMKLSRAATLAACTAAVQAFSDSSPFILFSTAKLAPSSNDAQLQTSSKVIAAAQGILSSCPTQRYIFISQPNIHAADIRDKSSGCKMPNLCGAIASKSIKGNFNVAEVIGQVSSKPLAEYVTGACLKKGVASQVERVELEHLPGLKETAKRAEILSDNDHELGRLFDALDGEYTVVMFSDPNEFKAYEPEFMEPTARIVEAVHMDLKRDDSSAATRKKNATDNRPLFEKYQFFTPGIFSGLIALIVILSILAVGLRSLASLEVSYGAFDKENGPAAQKKL